MSTDRLAAMETFVRVVEAKSFSAAARMTGASQPTVSKTVAELEQRLGTRLLNRTTRHLSLTEAGAIFYDRCRSVIAEIEDAEREARLGQASLRGTLRVNTSAVLAMALVQPALLTFRTEHPGVSIDLIMDDQRIDPVEEAVDLIVRFGVLEDSSLVARRAGSVSFGYFAAPSYLERSGHPLNRLEDLNHHEVITLRRRRTGSPTPAKMSRQDRQARAQVPIIGSLAVTSAVLAREAVLAGAGIALLPWFLVAGDLTTGRLVHVLPGVPATRAEVTFLHPFGATPPQRVAAFIEFAVRCWRGAGHVMA